MFKVVTIEGKQIPMKATGRTARLYARYFNKDFISSFLQLKKLADGETADTAVFEEIAWTLAKTANESIPEIDEWLDQFDSPLSIFKKAKDVLSVIDKSFGTTVNPKKKDHQKKTKHTTSYVEPA